MPFVSRKNALIDLCIVLALFILTAGLAAILLNGSSPAADASSSSASFVSSEDQKAVPPVSSLFTQNEAPDDISKIEMNAQSGEVDSLPYIVITIRNTSESSCFYGNAAFGDALGDLAVPYLAPGSAVLYFFSGLEPPIDLTYVISGNFYNYASAYPVPYTAIYLDRTLSGVQLEEFLLKESNIRAVSAYLAMDEVGALPISLELPFFDELALSVNDSDLLSLSADAVRWDGGVRLGETFATEVVSSQSSEVTPSLPSSASSGASSS